MLPAERSELAQLANDAEAAIFVREFWRRRDPDPEGEGNVARRRFEERVAAADRQYAEPGLRGSLTPRGGALILLGPPHLLRQERRAVPAWRPAGGRGAPMPVRRMAIETWEYRREELPPNLALRLASRGEDRIVLVFALEERVKLIDGDHYLGWAAEATVRLEPAVEATSGGTWRSADPRAVAAPASPTAAADARAPSLRRPGRP